MIETVEDVEKYIELIKKGCVELAEICLEAGFGDHASIFFNIGAAFASKDIREVEAVAGILSIYNKDAIKRHFA